MKNKFTIPVNEIPIIRNDNYNNLVIVTITGNGKYISRHIGCYSFKLFGIHFGVTWYYSNSKNVWNRVPNEFGETTHSKMFADLYV